MYADDCVESWPENKNRYRHYSQHNNEADCVKAGGKWLPFINYLERTTYNEQQCKQRNNDGNNRANRSGKLLL